MSEPVEEAQLIELEGEEDEEETLKTKWVLEIKERLGAVKEAEESCIYQVPSKLRKVREDAYNPRVVSIGPFHRKNTDLVAAMREHKWRYMLRFLQQTDDPDESHECLEHCTNAIYNLDKEVRQCYAENIDYDKNELARIMLLDGCFILELFLRYYAKRVEKEDGPDPVLKSAWMIAALQHDLALLENQIPFFILKRLYDIVQPRVVINGHEAPHSVAGLALMFFQPLSRKPIAKDQHELGTDFKHLLDLLHKFYFLRAGVPGHEVSIKVKVNHVELVSKVKSQQSACLFMRKIFKRRKQQTASCLPEPDEPATNNKWGFNYCASELLESGIQFQIGSWEDNLLNITFSNGVISIPQLIIDEATSSVFRNLLAFEQYSLSSTHGVTSYAFLMKSLIRSSADSKLLREKGIIRHNRIGDHEYLSQFKDILDEVVVKDDFYFDKLRDQVNEYCTSWCSLSKLQVFLRVRFVREIRVLFSTYFSSTWSFTSFLAAFALLILTSIQTYYTIHPRR
ncbi:hypothetical protein ACE6H2_021704 [Prunus campanulata]